MQSIMIAAAQREGKSDPFRIAADTPSFAVRLFSFEWYGMTGFPVCIGRCTDFRMAAFFSWISIRESSKMREPPKKLILDFFLIGIGR